MHTQAVAARNAMSEAIDTHIHRERERETHTHIFTHTRTRIHTHTHTQPKHSDGMVLGGTLEFLISKDFCLPQPRTTFLAALDAQVSWFRPGLKS